MSEESFINLAEKYAILDKEKRELKDQLDEIKEEMNKVEEKLLKFFEKKGISNINIAGRTVYIHRQLWAGYKNNMEQAVVALKKAGLNDYVRENFNTHSLSAYFREVYRDREEESEGVIDPEEILDPDLKEEIKLSERVQLRSRKS
ncbi:MAG TPA: hypothetical protein VJ962_05860 [Clostridia bacterium]|nr:hypothetical protein [Clostridia bacterium]